MPHSNVGRGIAQNGLSLDTSTIRLRNNMWHYAGTVDEAGKKLTLEAEGPNFMADGRLTKFRDAYEFKTLDHIIVTSSMLGDDGKWLTFMTGEAKRTKNGSTR